MSVAPASIIAQDVAAVARWSGEACCSSKDTASRMNSPRNSKSSGTPHVSPEPKSQLCIGAEIDMEEEDISSQSGHNDKAATTLHGSCTVQISQEQSGKNDQQLRHAADRASPGHAESSGCATHNHSNPGASSNSHPDRNAATDDEDSSMERESAVPRPLEIPSSMHADVPAAMGSARSRQSIHVPMLSIDSSKPEEEPRSSRARSTKRQKTSHKASIDKRVRISPSQEEQRCLERLNAVEADPCQLATEQRESAGMAAVTGDDISPEELDGTAAEESLSRACSTPPAMNTSPQGKALAEDLSIKPEERASNEGSEPVEAQTGRRQKSGKHGRRSGGATGSHKRTSRAASNAQGSNGALEDEDYLPPGDANEPEQASSKKPRLRIRASHQSSCKPDALPPVPPSVSSRQPTRLRWGAGLGQAAPSVASPTGYRRLRSQPIDLTDLRPDAFAYGAPPKRSKNCALHLGISSLQQLYETQSTPLVRSASSGIRKPQPYWQSAHDCELSQSTESSLQQMRHRHAADSKLMDGADLPTSMDTLALGKRLGKSPLGKAMRSLDSREVVSPGEDQLLLGCKRLFPSFMSATLSAWDRKLESSCVSLFGETASCILARQQKDAQNAWDDLLARHAMEAATLESCQDSLSMPKHGNLESLLDSC